MLKCQCRELNQLGKIPQDYYIVEYCDLEEKGVFGHSGDQNVFSCIFGLQPQFLTQSSSTTLGII